MNHVGIKWMDSRVKIMIHVGIKWMDSRVKILIHVGIKWMDSRVKILSCSFVSCDQGVYYSIWRRLTSNGSSLMGSGMVFERRMDPLLRKAQLALRCRNRCRIRGV